MLQKFAFGACNEVHDKIVPVSNTAKTLQSVSLLVAEDLYKEILPIEQFFKSIFRYLFTSSQVRIRGLYLTPLI